MQPTTESVTSAPIRSVSADETLDPAFHSTLKLGPELFRHMVRARVISARMVALQRAGKIGYHSASVGREASTVAAAVVARPADWVFASPRDWYVALARGASLEAYAHHAFGSARDPAKGHSTPDHLPARESRVVPPSGIGGAHLAQAAGAAWAAKIRGDKEVRVIALFDERVTDSGDFHNALNFAGVFKAPVVFIRREAARGAPQEDPAVAYGIASARVDGADPLAVAGVVSAALARAGAGPTLVNVVSPTALALTTLDDDALAGGPRLFDLGAHDPLAVLRRTLVREGVAVTEEASLIHAVREELDRALSLAEQAGPPDVASLFEGVYADVPAHLAAERATLTTQSEKL